MTASPLLTADYQRARVWPHLPQLDWCRLFLPHYGFGRTPPADFHPTLAADLDTLHTTRGQGRAYVAPRNGAKSVNVTLAYTLRSAVQGRERHVILLSDTGEQARAYLANIKTELEGNGRLATAYQRATGPGPEWSADRIRLPNGVLVEAFGRGAAIRGRRNRQSRPSLIVIDDVQKLADVRSATERDHAWKWFTREVKPAGDERTNFLSVGSALHREAVAVKVMALPRWVGRTFPAMHSLPTRLDLWDECLRLATNLADLDRSHTARRFYDAHRPAMDAGGRVYWPAKWSLFDMMMERATVGPAAWETEYQGNPASAEGAEWESSYFDRIHFDEWPEGIVCRVQAIDPSKGTGSTSADYQGHVLVALVGSGPFAGHLFVDAEAWRESNYVGRMLDLAARWKPDVVVAEGNNTMGLLIPAIETQLAERQKAGRPIMVRVEEKINTGAKLARVRTAGEYLRAHRVHVRNTVGGRMLVDQWRDVPNGEFDDLPDAFATALAKLEQLYGVRG